MIDEMLSCQYDSLQLSDDVLRIFDNIEQGIHSAEIESFSSDCADRMFVSIKGSNAGYVSASQAKAVLKDFLIKHKQEEFIFSRYGETEGIPFATGESHKGLLTQRQAFKVYVSLAQIDDRWVITQFIVY